MGSSFSVFYFVPETLAEERLAFGVAAIDEETGASRALFANDWSRARCFGHEDPGFLVAFAEEIYGQVGGSDDNMYKGELTIDRLKEMAGDFQNLIRVSDPRYIDMSAAEFIEILGPRFVRDLGNLRTRQTPQGQNVQPLSKTVVARRFRDLIESHIVHRDYEFPGDDIAISAQPKVDFFANSGSNVSFDVLGGVQDRGHLNAKIDAEAWKIGRLMDKQLVTSAVVLLDRLDDRTDEAKQIISSAAPGRVLVYDQLDIATTEFRKRLAPLWPVSVGHF